MDADRDSVTHHFHIEGVSGGTIIAGLHPDGSLGEVFIKGFGKEGSTITAFLEAFATMLSVALQYGVPLEVIADKFIGMKFDPRGKTDNPEIRKCKSIIDYVFRWLVSRFGDVRVLEGVSDD